MNAKKLLFVTGLAVVAASANAVITLYPSGAFTLGGVFAHDNPLQPSYAPNSSLTSITVTANKAGSGSLNQWWFADVDSTNITSVTYQMTVSDLTAISAVSFEVTVMPYTPQKNNPGNGTVGKVPLFIDDLLPHNVFAITGSTAGTQTLDFTFNMGVGVNTFTNYYGNLASIPDNAFYKANFQITNLVPEPTPVAVLAVGALGLLMRRRRSK